MATEPATQHARRISMATEPITQHARRIAMATRVRRAAKFPQHAHLYPLQPHLPLAAPRPRPGPCLSTRRRPPGGAHPRGMVGEEGQEGSLSRSTRLVAIHAAPAPATAPPGKHAPARARMRRCPSPVRLLGTRWQEPGVPSAGRAGKRPRS
eukprot:366241-Chlamydomonas_euryale.AAC.9